MTTDDQTPAQRTFSQVVERAVSPSLDATLARVTEVSAKLERLIVATQRDVADAADAVEAMKKATRKTADYELEVIEERLTAMSAELQLALAETRSSAEDRTDKAHADVVRILAELRSTLTEMEDQTRDGSRVAAERQLNVQSGLATAASAVAELSRGMRLQRIGLIGLAFLWVLLVVVVAFR